MRRNFYLNHTYIEQSVKKVLKKLLALSGQPTKLLFSVWWREASIATCDS